MAGVLLHLAMGDPEKTDPENSAYTASFKKAYTLGLLLPDMAKRDFIRNDEDFIRLFQSCAAADLLTYEEYLLFRKNHHFNPSRQDPSRQDTRNPNLEDFLNTDYVDIRKPVWQGVFCHLMGDKLFYNQNCVDFERLKADYAGEGGAPDKWDENMWGNSKTARAFYDEYNLLNRWVEEQYEVFSRAKKVLSELLLNDILDRFHVRFPDVGTEPVYMNVNNIKRCIAHCRSLIRTYTYSSDSLPSVGSFYGT